MDAVAIFRNYLESCIELAPLVMGPTGPLAMPATIAPPIIDIEGVKIDASNASDTHRLYEILRGVCSSTPGATPVSSVASLSGSVESDVGSSDSVSQTGLGESSEELIDELDGQVGVVVVEQGNTTQEQWMCRVDELVARRARQDTA